MVRKFVLGQQPIKLATNHMLQNEVMVHDWQICFNKDQWN